MASEVAESMAYQSMANNSMQLTALRAAADAGRSLGVPRDAVRGTKECDDR